jgi:hypothetical protein
VRELLSDIKFCRYFGLRVSVGANLRVHFVNSEVMNELRAFLEIGRKIETR